MFKKICIYILLFSFLNLSFSSLFCAVTQDTLCAESKRHLTVAQEAVNPEDDGDVSIGSLGGQGYLQEEPFSWRKAALPSLAFLTITTAALAVLDPSLTLLKGTLKTYSFCFLLVGGIGAVLLGNIDILNKKRHPL